MQTSIISIKHLISEAECHETIRQLRWSDGVICPHGDSGATIKRISGTQLAYTEAASMRRPKISAQAKWTSAR